VKARAQGETTSAMVGQVRDTTNAVVPGATVTIANSDTGLKRAAKTDDADRFNFPQLKAGCLLGQGGSARFRTAAE